MRNGLSFLLIGASLVCLASRQSSAVTFFSDDFESYALDGEVSSSGGWTISNTLGTVEDEAQWHLLDTKNLAAGFGLPTTVNFGPATIGGATTPAYDPSGVGPGGLFMASASDGLPPGLFPTLPDGSQPSGPALFDDDEYDSRLNNGTYTGAANDIITPSFSTAGAAGDVWLHASVSANLNDNGQAIFDVDVSTDGGATWVNRFRRISPGTGRDFASGDRDADVDVDGFDFLAQQRLVDNSDCVTCGANPNDLDRNRRNTDQRYSDWSKAFQGAYTPLVATVADRNAGGHHGELDVNLGAIGGQADVKVRFRHKETRDDESIAIDNVRVDEAAPAGSASVTIFSEDFNSMSLGQMGVYTWLHAFGAFGVDSGGGSGTISGFSWGAQDRPSPGRPEGRYEVGVVRNKNVHHLGHPTAEGANGEVPFAIIDPQAEEDGVDPENDNFQFERMHTPVLDFSDYETVILEWDDETIFDGNPFAGSVASVVLMVDDDAVPGPSDGDSILNEPDKFGNNDLFDPYLPYDQFGGGLFAGGDDPIFAHRRFDISADAAGRDDLYVAFQFVSSDTEYWAVDNILITGELAPAGSASIPEPAAALLLLVGAATLASTRRPR